jgi:hypothetical protein
MSYEADSRLFSVFQLRTAPPRYTVPADRNTRWDATPGSRMCPCRTPSATRKVRMMSYERGNASVPSFSRCGGVWTTGSSSRVTQARPMTIVCGLNGIGCAVTLPNPAWPYIDVNSLRV